MGDFWAKFLDVFLQAVLPVLAAALAAWLITQVKLAWAKAKAYNPNLAEAIEWAATIAVRAAEQAGAAQLITDKKAYALEVAENWLKLQKLPIDLHALDAAIEAAVWGEINKDKPKALTSVMGYSLPSNGGE